MYHSPLFRIPQELRTNIYELALSLPTPIRIGAPRSPPDPTKPPHSNLIALQLTCHQLQAESAGIICHANDFVLRYTDEQGCCVALRDFLTDIGSANAHAVRKITVEFDTSPLETDRWDAFLKAAMRRFDVPAHFDLPRLKLWVKFCFPVGSAALVDIGTYTRDGPEILEWLEAERRDWGEERGCPLILIKILTLALQAHLRA